MDSFKSRDDAVCGTIIYESCSENVFFSNTENDISTKKPKKPIFAIWEINTVCNMNCKYCSTRTQNLELNIEDKMYVIKQLKKSGVFWIQLSGGEPTLLKELPQITQGLKLADIDVHLFSNGTRCQEILNVKDNIKKVCISLDGFKESYKEITGTDNFETVISTIKKLLSEKMNVCVVITITQKNYHDVLELLNVLNMMGVKEITLNDLMYCGQAKNIFEDIKVNKQDMVALLEKINKRHYAFKLKNETPMPISIKGSKHDCAAGIMFFRITADGKVSPCSFVDPGKEAPNIVKGDILKIWNNLSEFKKYSCGDKF